MYDTVKKKEVGTMEGERGLFRDNVVGGACAVCGKRVVGGGIRRGSEWWNERVKMKVEEKKAEVKRVVNEAKREADF